MHLQGLLRQGLAERCRRHLLQQRLPQVLGGIHRSAVLLLQQVLERQPQRGRQRLGRPFDGTCRGEVQQCCVSTHAERSRISGTRMCSLTTPKDIPAHLSHTPACDDSPDQETRHTFWVSLE